MDIPTVDIESLRRPAEDGDARRAQARAAEAMGRACREVGFFYVRNHGVDEALQTAAFAASNDFFAEPADVKRAVDARQSRLYRGYNSLEDGAHNCKRGMGTRDGKESFVVGMEEGTSPMHGKNQWPADDKFRQNIEPYFAAVRDAGLAVARGLALSLGLDESFFLDRLTSPVAQMVLLRYEAESRIDKAAVGDTIGCSAHTDCGFLTLLVQDSTPGLEVQLPQTKEWVSAPARPGCLLVNLGDMVSAWTDGALVSTTHRVVSHPTQARQSIVVFMNPDFDAEMRAGTTCGQYLLSKLGLMWLDAPSAPAPE